VRNKMLAYAYILTAEGYPCVFYRDYSADRNCFGLKLNIDRLIWIHEHLASGETQQRWKDGGVFAFERMGGGHLLVGLNKDEQAARTITVDTGFGPHVQLQEFTGHGGTVTTTGNGQATLTIPKNVGGLGYVCYARPAAIHPFAPKAQRVTQDYDGAADLDIPAASDGTQVKVCRISAEANTGVEARLSFDAATFGNDTEIEVVCQDPNGVAAGRRRFDRSEQGAALQFQSRHQGFHTFFVQAANAPAGDKELAYTLRVSYRAPQTI
jgi:alpha-amylase